MSLIFVAVPTPELCVRVPAIPPVLAAFNEDGIVQKFMPNATYPADLHRIADGGDTRFILKVLNNFRVMGDPSAGACMRVD